MTTRRDLRQARYERACWWLEHGVDVVPLKPQSKELQSGYGKCKTHIRSADFARRWFLNTEANLGVVLGGPASLVVGDWDSAREYESWHDTAGRMVDTLVERTCRGYHVFFIGHGVASIVGNGCELKTSGVCMVSPSVHPSGAVYQIVNDVLIATIDAQTTYQLFPFLSERQSKQEGGIGAASTRERVPGPRDVQQSGGVVARIKASRSIVDEMRAAGVELRRGGADALVGLCPFHNDHLPSLWVYPRSGLWGCNRPDCQAAGTHDVINFRAMLRGISNDAAIRQMASELLLPNE